VCGTNTGATVLDWFVCDAELSQVLTNYFRLNFNLILGLAVVNANNAANHFGHNDHVSKMRLDALRLLQSWSILFCLT